MPHALDSILLPFLQGVWTTTGQMAPWLLFGFLAAGLVHAFVPERAVERHLGGAGFLPVVKASLAGVPLPLCSCGVIPVAASLRRHGASRGATTAFLISTPQTGVDSILATWSLLGPVFALFRPLAAFLGGLAGGLAVDRLAPEPEETKAIGNGSDAFPGETGGALGRAFRHGFVTLPADLAGSLAAGLVVAGAIAALVPPDFFAASLGRGLLPMLAMIVVGAPLYVCATGSIPVAAALMARGVSPGAALVFLVVGPATNAASILAVARMMGRRAAALYVGAVAATGLLSGIALDALFALPGMPVPTCADCHVLAGYETLSALLLLLLLAPGLLRRLRPAPPAPAAGTAPAPAGCGCSCGCAIPASTPAFLILPVHGMRCGRCAAAVERALRELPGVTAASVSLERAECRIEGMVDPAAAVAAIRALGYTEKPNG